MFEIKIDDAKYWKSCVDSIVNLVDEGSFKITKENISLSAMDPSGISMLMFSIPNKTFSKYDIDKDITIGLNIDNFAKILSSARSDEQLVMKENNNKLSIEFIGPNGKRRYKLPLIDTKKESDKAPKVEFESIIEMKSEMFKEILKDASLLSSYIGFKADKNSFAVTAKGDVGELEEEHLGSTDAIKKINIIKSSSATFNLEYLERIVSGCPSESSLELSLKTDEPIKIDYKIGDASFSYFLAPYMES
ncbi:MAG: proliferating cell nuclear antigen (pcna) [Candidatus Marsarchaeota archaeon]|jgi:proliferating cell nuclear antigen|nr:proliferating cell nuclear antigen (pcna) [Candidatus Marsarchaeota archaeon]